VCLYSSPKINRRLNLRLPDSELTFAEVCQKITTEDLRRAWAQRTGGEHYRKYSENFITLGIRAYLDKDFVSDFDEEVTSDGKLHLALTSKNEGILWSYFVILLDVLLLSRDYIIKIRQSIRTGNPMTRSNELDVENYYGRLHFLDLLLHKSRAFWHLCHNSALNKAILRVCKFDEF
jgi:chromatin segregation and condensation protein Rec8/ScpA/Scc1 (kleisin family)